MAQATQQLQDLKKLQEKESSHQPAAKDLIPPPLSNHNPYLSSPPALMTAHARISPVSTTPHRPLPVSSTYSPIQSADLKTESCTTEEEMREISSPEPNSLSPTEQSRLDFHPEENIELEDLEEFAKDFKQRRIKLGYTQVSKFVDCHYLGGGVCI